MLKLEAVTETATAPAVASRALFAFEVTDDSVMGRCLLIGSEPMMSHLAQEVCSDGITGARADDRINATKRAHSGLPNARLILIDPFGDSGWSKGLAAVETTAHDPDAQ